MIRCTKVGQLGWVGLVFSIEARHLVVPLSERLDRLSYSSHDASSGVSAGGKFEITVSSANERSLAGVMVLSSLTTRYLTS